MHAIVQDRYGAPERVLELRDLPVPDIAPDEVLVRVEAAAVAGDDWHLIRGESFAIRPMIGIRRPRQLVPSRDVAGRVAEVGSDVDRFAVGDEVFGCRGALAEYAAIKADMLTTKPPGVSAEQAAAVPVSALTALQALRDKGGLRPRHHVLVIGASGGVGTFAVQIARAMDGSVTGVCGSTSLTFVRQLGAGRVLDYGRGDYLSDGSRYDVIVDLVGDRSLGELRGALRPDGALVVVGGNGGRWVKGADRWVRTLAMGPFVSQRLRPLVHQDRLDDLEAIRDLIEAGHVRPVVSAIYPLHEAARAISHFAAGHGRGKVVIRVADRADPSVPHRRQNVVAGQMTSRDRRA